MEIWDSMWMSESTSSTKYNFEIFKILKDQTCNKSPNNLYIKFFNSNQMLFALDNKIACRRLMYKLLKASLHKLLK